MAANARFWNEAKNAYFLESFNKRPRLVEADRQNSRVWTYYEELFGRLNATSRGICTSRTATSGHSVLAFSTASTPSVACATSCQSGRCAIIILNEARATSWSSAIRSRAGIKAFSRFGPGSRLPGKVTVAGVPLASVRRCFRLQKRSMKGTLFEMRMTVRV